MLETIAHHPATPWVGLLLALGLTIGFVIGYRPRLAASDLLEIVLPAVAIFAGFRIWLAFETQAFAIGMSAFAIGGFLGLALAIALRRPVTA